MGCGGAILGGIIGGMIFGPLGAVIGGIVGGAAGEKSETKNDSVNDSADSTYSYAGSNGKSAADKKTAGGSAAHSTYYTYVGGNRGSATASGSAGRSTTYTYVRNSRYYDAHSEGNRYEYLFRSFGRLAKLDGLVSQAEAALVTSFLRELGFPSSDKKLLIAAFNSGKNSSTPFRRMVEEVKNAFPSEQYPALMQVYCDLVLADGTVSEVELDFLRTAERVFGLVGFVDRWYDSVRDASEAETPPPEDDLDWAYRILGVTPQSTPDEIKRAWRDKAKEYHPDKLRGRNVPESVIKLAASKFRQAQGAYEQIKRARNF